MKESVRSRKRYSMKWRLVGILLLCWLIPFSVMFGVMVVYVASNNGAETAENFRNQLEFNNTICMERLNAAVEASRQASYDGQLLDAHSRAEAGALTEIAARREYMNYLAAHYLKNAAASCTFLVLQRSGDVLQCLQRGRGGELPEIKNLSGTRC